MAIKVVDSSALAAILFDEPEADIVADRLFGATLVAPSLLSYELANVCSLKMGRYPETASGLASTFRLRERLGVRELAIDHPEAVDLARKTGLTAYDASYLWLAHRLGVELVTLDRQLERAAASALR
jgi:predicted nucleic acid-binding protein